MSQRRFFILRNSNDVGYCFKAIGYRELRRKPQSMEDTIDGGIDVVNGSVYRHWQYNVRVPMDAQTDGPGEGLPNWGSYPDLISLYELVNPEGSPTSILTLTDHLGVEFENCAIVGDMAPEPLTTVLEGVNAWMIVQIEIRKIR